MHTWVYRPSGNGPFPLAIINHGSSSNPRARLEQTSPRFDRLTMWLVSHGYAVAIPLRPGHGETGGAYLEDYGACDDPDFSRASSAIARSIKAVVDAMMRKDYIRKTGLVLIGHSAGGWGSLALASQNVAPLSAVINFAGGLGGRSYDLPNRNCAPDRLAMTAATFGRTTRVPTLWLYAANDTYFGPELSATLANAYRQAGGSVEFHLLPASKDDGHFLIRSSDAWMPILEKFLATHR